MKIVLKNTELEILETIAYIIDIEEQQKLHHSLQTAVMAKCLAEEKCKESASSVYVAGLLHDVGTFDIPNRLVHHEAHLENKEVSEVRIHPQKGAAIVATLPSFIPIAKIILDHHEWINGKGYPRGLKQDEICLESQILRIADKVAFLIYTSKSKKIMDIQRILEHRVGNEFSKNLYDCLFNRLKRKNIWESIIDEQKLIELNKEVITQLPIKKERDLNINESLLRFLGSILDAKHSYTEGHSRRVAYFSMLIALALNLPDEKIERIKLAAFLHDIGKVGIPKSILDKKERLTPKEFQIIEKHASFSHEIVRRIAALEKLADIVGADQEHWDGSGYPEGLKMEEIPIEARIIFIADAFDAMTSNRSYHKAISVQDAINELKRCSGKDFDPKIVNVACKLFEGFTNSAILTCYINND